MADFALLDLLLKIKAHPLRYSNNSPEAAVVCRVRTNRYTMHEISVFSALQIVLGDLWHQLKQRGWAEIEFAHRSGESGFRNLDNPKDTYLNSLPKKDEAWQIFMREFLRDFNREDERIKKGGFYSYPNTTITNNIVILTKHPSSVMPIL